MAGEALEDVKLMEENEMLRLLKSNVDKIFTEMEDKYNNLRKLDFGFGSLSYVKN